MIRKKKDGVEWLEFELLADIPWISHGVFLKHGGVSEGPYASLNAGMTSGDDARLVQRNREKIRAIISAPLIMGKIHHKTNIGCIPFDNPNLLEDCDGMVTKQKHLGLMITHADCQAALFVDPKQKVVANIHCGWRGNVQNIYAIAIDYLKKKMGCHPENLLVGISPSLGPEASEFKNYEVEIPQELWEFQYKPTYFNLWEMSRMQLEKAGILPHHIQIAGLCTHSCPEDYFSYRREKLSGRNATVINIRS
jgi:hypothetical protein